MTYYWPDFAKLPLEPVLYSEEEVERIVFFYLSLLQFCLDEEGDGVLIKF